MPRSEGSPKIPRGAAGPQGPQGARHRQTEHQPAVGSLRGSRVGNGWAVTSASGDPRGGQAGTAGRKALV